MGNKKYKKNKSIHIRVTEQEQEDMIKRAENAGFATVSSYLRVLGLNAGISVKIEKR